MKINRKELINEHDMTKKMLDTLRNQSSFLREGDETDVISPSKNDSVYIDEVKKISDSVDPRLTITTFKIYPNARDVKFEGRLDSGINFFMSSKAMKLSISITDEQGQPMRMYLDDDLLGTLQKLNGYYANWVREWANKLSTEYKPRI